MQLIFTAILLFVAVSLNAAELVCNGSTTHLVWRMKNLDAFPDLSNCSAQLTYLDLSGNQITSIPAEIGTFLSLEELRMSSNMLQELPVQIGELINLRVLSISENQIAEFPAELGTLNSLQNLDAYGNPFQCLPRSVRRLPLLSKWSWVYLPVCDGTTTIDDFLTSRTGRKDTCEGAASKINGTAVGCSDYLHTTCSMNDTAVTVTKRWLSDLSSLGLNCAPDAPQVGPAEVVTYPRCDPHTGVAMACGGPNADNAVHRREGLVTLYFEDWQSCSNFDDDMAPTRRLSADVTAAADALTTGRALPPAPSLYRSQRAAPNLAAYKATAEAAREADMHVRKAELEISMAALNETGPACNSTTTFFYVGYDVSVDLSPCLLSLTELVVQGVDFSLIAPQVARMSNLQTLKICYTWNTQLPSELGNMRQLTRLETYGAQLDQWPEVLQRMPQLTHLVLSAANIDSLPPWLGKMRRLVYLDLSYNLISEIGDEIGQLTNLETLIMLYSHRYIRSLSPAIARVTHLKYLDLRPSWFLRLPAALAQLPALETVELDIIYQPCVPDAVRAMPILADKHYFDPTPSCEAVPRPIGYSQTRNDACLWDAYYGFWYKAACDGGKNKLYVTMYADAACTHQAKRKAVHPLQDFASVGRCTPQYGFNGTMTAAYSYCHN